MKRVRFNFLAQLLVIISVLAIGFGIFTVTKSSAADVSENYDISFTMDVGASLRIGEIDGNNGLKYTASMTKDDYETLMGNVGEDKAYEKITFGMLIAPATYDLSYDKVFGAGASYRWDLFDEETGTWNKTYLGGNTEGRIIVNIYGQDLYEAVDARTGTTYMEFRGGSMVNIKDTNLTRNFRGVGYIELTKANGDKDYIMATENDNVRTPYYIASVYVSGDYGLTDSQIEWLKNNYVEKSTIQTNTTTSIGLSAEDEIDLAAYGLPTGEYDYYVQQYIEKSAYDSGTYTYYKDYVGSRTAATVEGTIVDVSALEGTFAITAAFKGTNYGYTFLIDHYTPGTFVWNNVADYEKSVRVSDTWGKFYVSSDYIAESGYIADKTGTPAEGRTGDYYYVTATSYNDLRTHGIDGIGFRIVPVHGKEYYQTLFAGKSIILDYYYTKGGQTSDIYWQFICGYNLGTITQQFDYAQVPDSWEGRSGWLDRHSMSLNIMFAEWDNVINGVPTTTGGGAGSMIGLRNAVNKDDYKERSETCEGNVTFYFGNVHLTSNTMTYAEECYDLSGELIQTTNKTAALGADVTMTPGAVDGYVFVPGNVNNSLTGTVLGNNTLTLKAYYATSTTDDLTDGYTTIITDNSYSFADKLSSSVSSYTVTQYVVKDLGNDGTTDYVGIDVTSAYSGLISDNVLDMSTFDGIYRVTATATDGSQHSVLFERKVAGVFTWNNINEAGNDDVVGAALIDIWGSYVYRGTATITAVATDDAVVSGRSGYYYKVTTNLGSDSKVLAIKIFPVHTKAYYEALVATGDIFYAPSINIVKETSTDWNFYQGYFLGYPGSYGSPYYDVGGLMYSSKFINSFSDATQNNYGGYSMRRLSFLLDHWSSAINATVGGSFFGINNFNSDAAASADIYIGNVHLVPAYTTEYYTQNNDGTYSLNTSVVSYSGVSVGQTVNANTTRSITGYAYNTNANEVLSGTVNAQGLTLKVYYDQVLTYDREIYLWDTETSAYVKSEEYSSTGIVGGLAGTTVTLGSLPEISGYIFDSEIEGTVSSAVLALNTDTVLKAYYAYNEERAIAGLRNDSTLDFGIGEIESYTVTQYYVTTTNATVGTGAAVLGVETKNAVDVTDNYPDLFDEDGVLDTSRLDGIFKVAAKATSGYRLSYEFEQYTTDVFVWNNLMETGTAQSGEIVSRYMYDMVNGKALGYSGDATLSTVTTATDELLYEFAVTGGYDGSKSTADGVYFRARGTAPTKGVDKESINVRIFPVHSFDYYNTLWNGATVTYKGIMVSEDLARTSRKDTYDLVKGYLDNGGNGSTWNYCHRWRTITFTMNESVFVRASSTNRAYGTNQIISGAFYGMSAQNCVLTGTVDVYISPFTAVAAS